MLWYCVAFGCHCARASSQLYLSYEFELKRKRIILSEFAGSKRFLDRIFIRERRQATLYRGVVCIKREQCRSNSGQIGQFVWRLVDYRRTTLTLKFVFIYNCSSLQNPINCSYSNGVFNKKEKSILCKGFCSKTIRVRPCEA